MTEPVSCAYELDTAFRIVSVDEGWSAFAAANDAPELAPPAWPMGQSALACIADTTSAMLYQRLFQKALDAGTAVVVPLRCDGPACRRYLNLTIAPRRPDGLRIESRVLRVEDRPPMPLLDRRAARGEDMLYMCGWCNAIKVDDTWCEVEDAVARLQLFERERLPRVSHGICAACGERLRAELDRPSG